MRNRYLLLLDLPLVAAAAFGAFALRFNWDFLQNRQEFWGFLVAALLLKPVVWFGFGMYSRVWRYAGTQDLISCVLAACGSSVAMAMYVGVGRATGFVGYFSRPVLLLDWLLSLALLGGLRISIRIVGEATQSRRAFRGEARRVLVVGAGEAGTMVVRELQRNPQIGLRPVGFLDDAPEKQGKWINNVRVLGATTALAAQVENRQVDQVIIAMPAAGGSVVRRVAEMCRDLGVESRTVPGVFELLDGQLNVTRLRNVEITDLLRRDHLVKAESDPTASYLHHATVLVTGAGGSIGRELSRQAAYSRPSRLILLGHGENSIFEVENALRLEYPSLDIVSVIGDIRDELRMESVFAEHRPDVVFHAAAHKHVPLMEQNIVEAISNNVLGTYVVGSAAIRHGASRFVLISTDKAVAPTSIMGASKRVAESVAQSLAARNSTAFIVVRFGNVLGSRGSVVPLFKAQIERGGPVTVTHPDMKRFFMTIPEAVHLVLRAGGLGSGAELFVLNMGEPVRIKDLAEDLIQLSGFSLSEVPVVFTQLRPGEKLEEELWEPDASVEPTRERDILRVDEPASRRPIDMEALLERFRDGVRRSDRTLLEATLAQAIPTFAPTSVAAGGGRG